MADHEGFSPALHEARELLGQGQLAAALRVLEQAAAKAQRDHGEGSFEAALAQAELGAVLSIGGDAARAAEHYERAVRFDPGDDREKQKRLLTLRGELALALEQAGRHQEAERAFLDGLAGRADFYGREHPGYAFGLEPYAAFLARRGELERAIPLGMEAAANLAKANHPKLAEVLVLLARMQAQIGTKDPFEAFKLPGALCEQVGEALADPGEGFPPEALQAAAESFLRAARGQLEPPSAGLIAALQSAINAAQAAGDHGARRRHIEALMDLCRQQGEDASVQHLTVALALAAEDDGDPGEAERLLREGVRLANGLSEPRARCHALRQLGIFLAHQRQPEAERVLRTSLLEALSADDEQEANITRVALGIHLQHEGQRDEARELLAEAVAGLDPATTHAFSARNHLDAIERGDGCGCGGGERAYLETLEALVRPEIAEGLLAAIELGEGGLHVRLAREPTEEEAAQLDRAMRQALHRLQQGARAR